MRWSEVALDALGAPAVDIDEQIRPGSRLAASMTRIASSMAISCPVCARARSSSVSALRRTRLLTRAISWTSSTGLVRKSSAPACRPLTRSDGWSSAVIITTGTWAVRPSALRRRHTSNPSISGIITSSRTMSIWPSAQIARASRPDEAVLTSKYSAVRRASSRRTLVGISSTISTRAVKDRPPLDARTYPGFQGPRP